MQIQYLLQILFDKTNVDITFTVKFYFIFEIYDQFSEDNSVQ